MKLKTSNIVVLLLSLAGAAQAAGPETTGAVATPANRLVGIWTGEGFVSPCGTPTPTQPTVRATFMFHAGGTVTELPRFPPPGANSRTMALGSWSYDPGTGAYQARFRFDTYVNGAYNGYTVVDRELLMSADDQEIAGDVHAVRYDANGNPLGQLCGFGVSRRD